MNIAIVGTGYVGLVTGTCFAQMGNNVTCVDIDKDKIEGLKKGIIPIYEPGLDSMIEKNYKSKNINFTTNLEEALEKSTVVFIAVGTPMSEDGSADLQYVLAVAKDIGKYMNDYKVIIDKSTVPVGTADKVRDTIQAELDKREKNIKFDVVSNPEFLKEGAAIVDFMKPNRVVIGADSQKAMEIMKELYRPFTLNHERFIGMDTRSAELTKYAANAMLATKISFMNEMSQIAENVGANINMVRHGIGSDNRIGYSFIYPGCGYGGSCFPKDVNALVKIAEDSGYKPKIIPAVEEVNANQKMVLVKKVIARFGEDLKDKTFAIWGLSFKPGTDDMREAPSIVIIKELLKRGAKIKAYDPEAMENSKNFWLKNQSVEYKKSKYDTLDNANALLLITEWKEFRSPDFDEIKKRLKETVIFDGRNQYDKNKLENMGIEYFQIGVR